MQTTGAISDSLSKKSDALAASHGATGEQFIVETAAKEVQATLASGAAGIHGDRKVELPVIRSGRSGTLGLSRFDFDDLLT